MTFDELKNRWGWKPMRGCPGRYILPGTEFNGSPYDLLGAQTKLNEFQVDAAEDPVVVARLAQGGGLISYRRADRKYVHTLNTEEGFRRKLDQLGIRFEPTSEGDEQTGQTSLRCESAFTGSGSYHAG